MFELAETRLAFFKKQRRDQISVGIVNPELSGLGRISDRLVNGDEVKVREIPAQLETMALSDLQVARVRKPGGKLPTQVKKKGGNPPGDLGEVFAAETLQTDRLAGAHQLLALKAA